ncbi:MAG: DUF1566 domain-containing protein [Chitinophagaceae bacterium]|nr:DUF1566 domain-containing protein [Oligoflexus sp.]
MAIFIATLNKLKAQLTFFAARLNAVNLLLCLLLLMGMNACDSNFVAYKNVLDTSAVVISFDRIAADKNESVLVTGRNLDKDITIEMNGVPVDFQIVSKTKGSFVIPTDAPEGLTDVKFNKSKKSLGLLPLVIGSSADNIPVMTVSSSSVCNDIIYKDKTGTLTRGERPCGDKPACSEDGQIDCLAVATFPAVDKRTKLSIANAALIHSTITIAGVKGTMSNCSADGATSCLADTSFPSADASVAAAKIVTGQTLAGIPGTASSALANCAADGATGCVAITNFPAVNKVVNLAAGNLAKIHSSVTVGGVVGTMSDCAADGGTGCMAIATFPAAIASGAAAKIVTGQTLAGVSGTATPAPANCAADGATGCVAVTNFPAVDKVTNLAAGNLVKIHTTVTVGGVVGTMASCSADGGLSCMAVTGFPAANTTGAAAKILTGQTLAGVAGSATVTPGNCSTDNQTNCVTTSTNPAVIKANVTADLIKNGTVIAGVTGAYPSATYPLAGATGTADLDAATFNAKVKSATAFEYWDSAGGYQTGAGSANITAANIVTGVSIFGSSGTAPADCLYGTQGSCQADTKCSWTGSACEVDPWNIRAGVTLGGKAGALKTSCRNRGSASTWDTGLPYSAVVTASTPTIAVTGHPFSNGDIVRIDGSTAPTGLTLRTQTYFVVNSVASTSLQLSLTSGGTAITPSTGANVNIYKWTDGTVQWWDTIDDYNNNLAFPTALVSGFTSSNDCSSADWQDLTADGTCDAAADDCMMKDKISGLTWSESYPVTGAAAASTAESWFSAIQHCNNLNFGGYATGWRLPTQKELMDAYAHGIRDVGFNGAGVSTGSTNLNANFIADVDTYYWSASTTSYNTSYAWLVHLSYGATTNFSTKSPAYLVLCVR